MIKQQEQEGQYQYFKTSIHNSECRYAGTHLHLVDINADVEPGDFYIHPYKDENGEDTFLIEKHDGGYWSPAYKIIASTDNNLGLPKLSPKGVIMTNERLKESYDEMSIEIERLKKQVDFYQNLLSKIQVLYEKENGFDSSVFKELEEFAKNIK